MTPKPYDKNGFSIAVDRTWFLDSDQQTENGRVIYIDGPGDARIEITILADDKVPDLAKYAKGHLQKMRPYLEEDQELVEGKTEPMEGRIGNQNAKGLRFEWTRVEEKIYPFHYVDWYLTGKIGSQQLLVMCTTRLHTEADHDEAFRRMLGKIRLKH